jgi:hypothetical protein
MLVFENTTILSMMMKVLIQIVQEYPQELDPDALMVSLECNGMCSEDFVSDT